MGRFILGVAVLISVIQVSTKGEEALPLLVLSLLVTGLALCVSGGRQDDAGT